MEHFVSQWQPGRLEERPEQRAIPALASEGPSDSSGEIVGIGRCLVGQVGVLGVIPDLFRRVKVRRVAREPFDLNGALVTGKVAPDDGRLVHTPTIPDENDPPSEMASKPAKEQHQVVPADVPFLKGPIEPNATALWCHGERADGRDPIVTRPLAEDGRLTPRSPGAPDERLQHEAAFIQKDHAPSGGAGVFLYAASADASTDRWLLRRALSTGGRASADSTRRPGGSSKHGRDDTEPRRCA